jgi:hypothetical protein
MSLGILFWIIMLVWILLWGGAWVQPANVYLGRVHPIVLWILMAILGWAVFGPMVHG